MKKHIRVLLAIVLAFSLTIAPAYAAVVGHSSFTMDLEEVNVAELQATTT